MKTEAEAMAELHAIALKMHAEGKIKPPQTVAVVVERPLEDVFAKISELTEQRTEQFRAYLANASEQRECKRHPGQIAVLNEEASHAATDAYWSKPEQIRLIYRCPQCISVTTVDRRARKIVQSGIPADVRHATFDNFDTNRCDVKAETDFKTPADFLAKTKTFASGSLRNLFLCGTPGIGKGHLAAAVAIERLNAGESIAWIECARLFNAYHEAYANGGTEAVTVKYAAASLLVLDEICLRNLPADGEEILFAILDRRHKAGLQTLLLGNAIAEDVRKWLGSRIVDRLRSGGVAFCYGEWASMRGATGDGAF